MAKKRGRRLESALRLRDAALIKIKAEGRFEEVTGIGPVLAWDGDGLTISHHSPFQKHPQVSGEQLRRFMEAGLMPKDNLPYGLDIWDREGAGKVLNIEWDNQGPVILVSFRRGEWETKVLAYGQGEADREVSC